MYIYMYTVCTHKETHRHTAIHPDIGINTLYCIYARTSLGYTVVYGIVLCFPLYLQILYIKPRKIEFLLMFLTFELH